MEGNNSASFISTPGFCSDCGSILPLLGDTGDVKCYACKRTWGPEAFGDMAMSYTIQFNTKNVYGSAKQKDDQEEEAEGPVVERKCPQCQNDKMSYATLQLRSADEGQTVFYTCTKCKYVFLNSVGRWNFRESKFTSGDKDLFLFFTLVYCSLFFSFLPAGSKKQRILNTYSFIAFQALKYIPQLSQPIQDDHESMNTLC